VRVKDDGDGFDINHPPVSESGFGMVGMRERAALLQGDIEVVSAPGKGTEVRLAVPIASGG
jgi:signal transduction histidine kinase